jgi:AcrR family transcriptional regulator
VKLAVSPPQQERSALSFARFLDATERLLERNPFEQISVAAIAAEAGTSVGNFYGRFSSKDALLVALHERYEDDRTKAWAEFLADPSLARSDLKGRVWLLVAKVIALYRARRGVFRTLVMRQWGEPQKMSARSRRLLTQLYDDVFKLLWARREEIRRARPERAVRIGLAAVLAACRENIVMRDKSLPASLNVSDAELAEELSEMFYAYLCPAKPSAHRRMR